MKRLAFRYHMEIQFDIPVHDHHFTLKCLPKSDARQRVEEIDCEVYPNYYISHSADSFQNESIYGFCKEEHDHFVVDVRGIVRTGLCEKLSVGEGEEESIYRYPTPHTLPGTEIAEYYRKTGEAFKQTFGDSEQSDVFLKALFLMNRLHEDYVYETGATEIVTTAEEALRIGRGVCQDYSHILLSLLRMDHIPCRYVTGMMMGEGLSHAWVEVLTEEGWAAIDPTNGHPVGEDYICIARGRDYKDCLLNQGVFTGCGGKATQNQVISVEVREIGQ